MTPADRSCARADPTPRRRCHCKHYSLCSWKPALRRTCPQRFRFWDCSIRSLSFSCCLRQATACFQAFSTSFGEKSFGRNLMLRVLPPTAQHACQACSPRFQLILFRGSRGSKCESSESGFTGTTSSCSPNSLASSRALASASSFSVNQPPWTSLLGGRVCQPHPPFYILLVVLDCPSPSSRTGFPSGWASAASPCPGGRAPRGKPWPPARAASRGIGLR